jgi:hypothetical protein
VKFLLLSILLLTACGGADPAATQPAPRAETQSPSPAGDLRTGPLGEDARASCAEAYSPTTLADRAFAFDGTVTSIGPGTTNRPDKGHLDTAAVTFAVNEWFAGGTAPTVTVDLMSPTSHTRASEQPAYEEGTRLLVSGEPRWGGEPLDSPIAWSCGGFTRYYDDAMAAEWRQATGG